jgi:hypothetical protein
MLASALLPLLPLPLAGVSSPSDPGPVPCRLLRSPSLLLLLLATMLPLLRRRARAGPPLLLLLLAWLLDWPLGCSASSADGGAGATAAPGDMTYAP